MKTIGFLSNALVLVSYIQLKLCFAVEEKKLIRRSLHQWANPGEECHHACDCLGYPDKPVCCEKRGPDMHKKCYRCCLQHRKRCKHDKDCCSQRCVTRVCVHNHDPQEPVGLCPILFPGDYLNPPPMGPPFAPFPYYVQPSKTGPLRYVMLCTKHSLKLEEQGIGIQLSKEDEEYLPSTPNHKEEPPEQLSYLIKGMCNKKKEWKVIQGGLLMKHWNGTCFKIPVIDYSQLESSHHTIDYTKYHILFFWRVGKLTYPFPLTLAPLKPNEELIMLAKCNEAWPYDGHAHSL